MRQRWLTRTTCSLARLFLLSLIIVVQCFGPPFSALSQGAGTRPDSTRKQQPRPAAPEVGYGIERLPAPVRDMREAILAAVRSGRIEDLRHAWELNELKPDLGNDLAGGDPIAHWKTLSGDGEGREILAVLGELLEGGYAILPLGPDLENNRIYVWPHLAEIAVDKLSPAQVVELLRLVSPAALAQMRAAGKYTHWRLAIGADGTWHSFRRGP